MNKLKYNIFLNSLKKQQIVEFNLQTEEILDQQIILNQLLPHNNEEYLELEVILGSGTGQLVEKSNLLEKCYKQIRGNLKFVINVIQNFFGIEKIRYLTLKNQDYLISIEDIFSQLIREFQFISHLNIYSRKELSIEQFNGFLEAICFKREKLDQLYLEMSLKDGQTKIDIHGQLEFIQNLSLCNFTQQDQLFVFKIAKEIKEVEIKSNNNNVFSKLKIQTIIDELSLLKHSLEKLYLEIGSNQHQQSQNCLKSLEKLENLKSLHIEAVNLKNENLDIQKLKKLEILNLIFPDAANYLSNYSNLNHLFELRISVGACNTSKLNLKQLKNLKILKVNFKQMKSSETKNTIQCLEKFSQIACQLDELQLDFSQSSYFKVNTMSPQLIQTIGIIFDKCNEETKIYLTNQNCQFNLEKRFELAMQMLKIKNLKKFYLNDNCIFNEQQDIREISQKQQQNKFPYYLSIFSQFQNEKKQVVKIDWNEMKDRFSTFKKHVKLFENFKAFSISSSIYGYHNQYSENVLTIVSEKVEYLKLPREFSLKQIITNSTNLKHLKKIESSETNLNYFIDNMSPQLLKECFSQKLHIILNNIYIDYEQYKKEQYQQILQYEGYIIEIKIDSAFKQQDFVDLFHYILNEKNIIYLNLLSESLIIDQIDIPEIDQKYMDMINNYSNQVQIEVLSINAFAKFFLEDINLNPKLLLLDLYF